MGNDGRLESTPTNVIGLGKGGVKKSKPSMVVSPYIDGQRKTEESKQEKWKLGRDRPWQPQFGVGRGGRFGEDPQRKPRPLRGSRSLFNLTQAHPDQLAATINNETIREGQCWQFLGWDS